MECLEPYLGILGEKAIIHQLVPREECVYELSKCDFLINLENIGDNQEPSKVSDYYLTGRPICSFCPSRFDPEVFEEFLRGEYGSALKVDIGKYDINRVARAFLSLMPG